MNINIIALFLIALSIIVRADHQLYRLSPGTDAKCLDGSPPGFYYSKGTNSGADKMFIFLEGYYLNINLLINLNMKWRILR